jgi:hypothetical protein
VFITFVCLKLKNLKLRNLKLRNLKLRNLKPKSQKRKTVEAVTMTLTLLQSVHSMAAVSSEEGWNCWMVQNNNLITEIADAQESFNVGPTTEINF